MKKCKSCQKEIDAKASKCPYCQTNLKNWFHKHPILTVILVLFLFSFFVGLTSPADKNNSSKNSENQSDAKKVNTSNSQPESTNQEIINQDKEFMVGDVINMRNWEITVNKVSKAKSKGYSTAKSGKEYVFVNVTLKNKGNEEVKGVGSLDFKIQDSNGVQDDRTYVSLDDEMQGYIDLAPGGILTGTIPFEVPLNDTNLKLIFQPNIWIDRQRIVINL